MKQGDFFIRPAKDGDIPAMLELWSGINEIQSASVPDDPEQVRRFLALNPTSFLVACRGEQLVGTIMGGYNGWRGAIYHLAVDHSCHRQGIGRQLMADCLKALRERGAPRVDLTTYGFNTRAQRFYCALGFTERDDINNFSFLYSTGSREPGNE